LIFLLLKKNAQKTIDLLPKNNIIPHIIILKKINQMQQLQQDLQQQILRLNEIKAGDTIEALRLHDQIVERTNPNDPVNIIQTFAERFLVAGCQLTVEEFHPNLDLNSGVPRPKVVLATADGVYEVETLLTDDGKILIYNRVDGKIGTFGLEILIPECRNYNHHELVVTPQRIFSIQLQQNGPTRFTSIDSQEFRMAAINQAILMHEVLTNGELVLPT
jgi:hypothetical protein